MRSLVFTLLLLSCARAWAVPPFARRYGLSCSTCHEGGPTKLSSFGEAFRDNGYRIPGDDAAFVREQPIPLGSQQRAALFPRTIWPGWLPATVPLGIEGLIDVNGTIPSAASGQKSTIAFDATALLLLGGSFGRHISFFGVAGGGTAGFTLQQLFLVGRSLFERWLGETHLNLKLGFMELDLFPVQPSLRRGFVPFLPDALVVGRDNFSLAQPTEAIEIYGLIAGRIKWLVGAANGSKPIDDVTARRDLFARVSTKLGGPRLDYRNATQGEEATTVGLGGSIYWGQGSVEPPPPEMRFRNDLVRLGLDARLRSHGFDVLARAVLGSDGNPDGLGIAARHVSWMASVEYAIFPWLQPYARYEEARFDVVSHPDQRRLVVGDALFVRANLRVTLEGVAGLTAASPSELVAQLFFAM
jgi:hypothetical protein